MRMRILALFLVVLLTTSIATTFAFVYTQQTLTIGQTILNVPYWYVDNNTSDVDSSADKGTHINFTAQQSGPNSVYDTLIEEDTGGSSTFGKTDIGATSFGFTGYLEASRYQCGQDGTVTQISLYLTGGASGRYARAAIYSDNSGVPGSLLSENNQQEIVSDGWHIFTGFNVPVSANTYYWLAFQISTTNLQWRYDSGVANQHAYRAYIYGPFPSSFGASSYSAYEQSIFATCSSVNYELDLEVQWMNVDYSEANEELCIYVANVDSSNTTLINAESFEGTWPPVGWTASGSWNKEGDQAYGGIYSADFDGQFSSSGDLSTPNLDCSDATTVYVDFWYRDDDLDFDDFLLEYYDGSSWDTISDLGSTFQEDQWLHYQETIIDSQYFVSNFRVRWRGVTVGFGETIYIDIVTIKKETAPENIRVNVWTGVTWQPLFTDLNNGWNNVTVSSYLTSSTFTIRYKGSIETNDTTQDNWQIDAALLHTWTP